MQINLVSASLCRCMGQMLSRGGEHSYFGVDRYGCNFSCGDSEFKMIVSGQRRLAVDAH